MSPHQVLFVSLFGILFRKIVDLEIHKTESMELSSELLEIICLSCLTENIDKNQLHPHSKNGGPMKGAGPFFIGMYPAIPLGIM
jgi:hypothetical protein